MKVFRRVAGTALSLALAIAMILPMGVNAEGEKEIPKITISVGKGQETPAYIEEAKDQVLKLNVENEGSVDAKNVKVTPIIDEAATWPFEITDMNNERIIDDVAPGENKDATWEKLVVRADAGAKSYKIGFLIVCDDGNQQYSITKYIFVKTTAKEKPVEKPAETPEEKPAEEQTPQDNGGITNMESGVSGGDSSGGSSTEKPTVPRVIVTGFNTDPGVVNAGNNFKLIVHLKNTSTRTAVSNMLFDLQAPASGTEGAAEAPAFLPSSGSSTVFLDSIPAGGTKDISIDLNARADLVQKPYSITMSMKYEDSSAAQFESASSLAIPVKQAARFEFSELEIAPEAVAVGEEANITCSLYNTGRIKLYNVKAKFQGEGIDAKEVFVGNVDSGATGAIDGIVTATKESAPDQKFKMVITYEDDAGNVSTVEKEFALQITPEQAAMSAMPMDAVPEEKGLPIVPIIIGVVVIAGIIITIIVIKKRKKKKESVEEEDLLNEVDRFTEDE